MTTSRLTIMLRIALVIAAFGVTAAIAHSSEPPAWKRALELRSQALDRRYGLGTGTHAAWYAALMQRSEALDRRYHLGGHTDAP
jgi:hypothetical protein